MCGAIGRKGPARGVVHAKSSASDMWHAASAAMHVALNVQNVALVLPVDTYSVCDRVCIGGDVLQVVSV